MINRRRRATVPAPRDRQRFLGGLIAGIFGIGFVEANATTPLGSAADNAFRSLAILGFIAFLVIEARARRPARDFEQHPAPRGDGSKLFGPRYWTVVAGEAAALVAGLTILRVLGAPQPANVAWIAFVVGTHFFAFAWAGIWSQRILVTAAAVTILGLAGLLLLATPDVAWIPFVSGVLSGLTLVAGSLSTAARKRMPQR